MAAITANARFLADERKYAEGFNRRSEPMAKPRGVGGMMHVVPVTLPTHLRIYRFASSQDSKMPDRLYGAFWWFGFSAYDALTKLAKAEGRGLRDVARECLAVPPEWGNSMELLVCAKVRPVTVRLVRHTTNCAFPRSDAALRSGVEAGPLHYPALPARPEGAPSR